MEVSLRPLPADDLAHTVEHAESAWRSLRGARLFITGATGFFGRWLLESLAAANARLDAGLSATLLSRDPGAFRARAPQIAACGFFNWLRGDVRDFAFPQGRYTHVLHLGASSDAALYAKRPGEMLDVLVAGTRRVRDFARAAGAGAMLLSSSGAVYGRQPPDLARVPEDYVAPAGDAAPYAEGKRAAEALCAEAAGRDAVAVKIARCFAFVGPHLPLDAHFAAGNFLRDALAGKPIAIGGDGTPLRSYLHPADLIVWLVTILARGEALRPYNVGSDDAVSIEALAREAAALRVPALSVHVARQPSGALPERYVPDVGRARRELGLEVRIGRREALARTFRWLQAA
jgi:nucleoside-diphosphate-sugar epimerase